MTDSISTPIVIRRVLPAPIDEVFAAWTDPEGMRDWFCPSGAAAMTADIRPGGNFRLVMTDETQTIEHTGVYRVVEPPNLLVFTWRSVFTGGRDTLVTVRLSRAAEKETELELTHELLPADEMEPHAGGWAAILSRLGDLLMRRYGGAD